MQVLDVVVNGAGAKALNNAHDNSLSPEHLTVGATSHDEIHELCEQKFHAHLAGGLLALHPPALIFATNVLQSSGHDLKQ